MTNTYIHRENVPVFIDGEDFGFTCTLVRDRNVDYSSIPDWYGIVSFNEEQARKVVDTVNSHNDENDPADDYLQGQFKYDEENDTYTEYSDNEGTCVYDMQRGFMADGVKLYCLGSDWCWSLEDVA